MDSIILEMRGITKLFPGVKALDNVNLSIRRGEIHALVGENGAGKSTLMNVLSGTYPTGPTRGRSCSKGANARSGRSGQREDGDRHHPSGARSHSLPVDRREHFLRNERARNKVIDWDRTHQEAAKLVELVGLKEHSARRSRTSAWASSSWGDREGAVEERQAAHPGRAHGLAERGRLGEPPAAPGGPQGKGLTSILISHKLNEMTEVADSITIIRDGSTIETLDKGRDEISENRIIKGMVGRELVDRFPSGRRRWGGGLPRGRQCVQPDQTRAAGDQGREHQGPQGRGGGAGADGGRRRSRHEGLRAVLRAEHQRERVQGRRKIQMDGGDAIEHGYGTPPRTGKTAGLNSSGHQGEHHDSRA